MKNRLLALVLATLMILSILPVAVFAGEESEGLAGTVIHSKTATWDYYQGNGLNPQFGVDNDDSTFWLSGGRDLHELGKEYYGINFGCEVEITDVRVLTNIGRPDANGVTKLQVSADGTTWVDAYELIQTAEEGQRPETIVSYDDFSAEAKAIDIRQIRVHRYADSKDAEGNDVWHNLRVYDLTVNGSYVIPEDAEMLVTMFDEPLSTTFGTRANLLAEPYVVQTSDLAGLTLLLKVEGIPTGATATMEGINPVVTSGDLAPDSRWAGNWVYNGRNGHIFEGNGYYAYYFNFKNLNDSGTLVSSVAGETTLTQFNVFRTDCAFAWWGTKDVNDSTISDDITLSLVGIVEGNIEPSAVFAYDENGEMLGRGNTTVNVDAYGKDFVWGKLNSGSDIYDGVGAGGEGESIVSWTDREGNALDFILGQSKIIGQYGVAPVSVIASTEGGATGGEMDIDLSVADNYQGFDSISLEIIYDNSVFTFVDDTEDDMVLVSDEEGRLVVEYTSDEAVTDITKALGKLTFAISENGFAREYEFGLSVLSATKGDKEITTKGTTVKVIPEGRREGFYDIGTFAYDEEVVIIDSAYTPYEQSNNMTLIVSVDGLNGGTLKLGGLRVLANGLDSNNSGNYTKGTTFTMAEDGYYAIQFQLGAMSWNGSKFETISRVAVNDSKNTRGGATEFIPAEGDTESAPTVTYHALFVGTPSSDITFYNGEDVLTTAKYSLGGQWCKITKMATLAELYTGEAPVKDATHDGKVTYEFKGWANGDVAPINLTEKVYADYNVNDTRTKYEIKFVNDDGTELYSVEVPEGEMPEYVGETPVKAADKVNSYVFAGWDAEIAAVTGDATYKATYTATAIEYTVIFMVEGVEVSRGTATYGTAVTKPANPTKDATAQYTYNFAAWVDANENPVDLSNITADITVYAKFMSVTNKYTVTFMNGDTEIGKSTVNYGAAAEMPAPPAKDATAEYTYEFAGWIDADDNIVDVSSVTADITVYAYFRENVRKYTVTFMNGEEELAKSTVAYGTAAQLPADDPTKEPDELYAYIFAGWVDAEGNEITLDEIKSDITVYASFTQSEKDVTVTFMNGEVEFEKVTVEYGAAAAATATPEKASENFTKYTFKAWVDAEGNEVDLSAVTADVTVYASYTTECEHSFPDLKAGEWYEEAVEWALMNGVMNGEGANFNPGKATTRAMLVTVLYRLEGSPDVSDVEHPFTDLKAGDWYYNAVLWAYDNGVVNGMTATTFAPTGTLTREQFATILYRYAKELKGEDVTVAEDATLDKYTDKGTISSYAADAVLWANVNGYIGGMTANTIAPKGNATRAQMATILYRYITAE